MGLPMRASALKTIAITAFAATAAISSANAADMAPATRRRRRSSRCGPGQASISASMAAIAGAVRTPTSTTTTGHRRDQRSAARLHLGGTFDMNGCGRGRSGRLQLADQQLGAWASKADAPVVGREGQRGLSLRLQRLIGGPWLPGLTFLPPGVTGTTLTARSAISNGSATLRGCAAASSSRPTALLYATGGLAYGSIKSSGDADRLQCRGRRRGFDRLRATRVRVGWTVGAGVEGMHRRATGPPRSNISTWISATSTRQLHRLRRSPAIRAQCDSHFTDPHPAGRHELSLRQSGGREILILGDL